MGYTTNFEGQLDFNRPLTVPEYRELKELGDSYEKEDYKKYTNSPETIPDSYLQWVPTDDGMGICWNGGEKFYDYIHWLRWLIKHVLAPKGLVLNGTVQWRGEEFDDVGIITATDNKITSKKLEVKDQVECPHCGERFVPDEE